GRAAVLAALLQFALPVSERLYHRLRRPGQDTNGITGSNSISGNAFYSTVGV
ncbi:hypothetical protein BGX24_009993, partial [Mortierella sp. AD032]